MHGYTVSEVATLSGVSVRMLHHYDQLGLLRPACVGANGYRYYGREELLRLQQILFHRELGFSLQEIGEVLDREGFDRLAALRLHRARLLEKAERCRELVRTIDATLADLEGEGEMDETKMFQGFDPKKQAEYSAWLTDRYGARMKDELDAQRRRMAGWTKERFDAWMGRFDAIMRTLAQAFAAGAPGDSASVQAQIRALHAWCAEIWSAPPTRDGFMGLAATYAEHPDFRARFEARAEGLTEYLVAAMRIFAERELD